jgi:DNA-binding transcriptional ArsR family regulator
VDYVELAEKCKGLAHPVRLQILDMLRGGEVCVCHIERALDRRQAYISQQLMVLRDAELVETRKEGLQVFYRLADPQLQRWLNLMFDSEFTAVQTIAGCTCPLCSTISIETIR